MTRILLVEDEDYVRESLVALFEAAGIECTACASAEEALEAPPCDAVLTDLRLPGMSGVQLLVRLKERDPATPVVVLTGHGSIPDAVAAMREGALDFLTKPVEPDVIVERMRKAVERGRIERDRDRLRGSADLVAESPGMRRALALADQVARQESPVLLLGETGTGKELLAGYVHERSARRVGPLVKVHCGAIPAALFEAELFGHAKGAFTGADRARPGRFVEADGGTLFLDEIGTLALPLQAKLLRVLESGELRPVGAAHARRVDVRVIAATNEDLAARKEDGTFRPDLYYRLAVFTIELPPLRDRPEDLLRLAERFAAPRRLTSAALKLLARHAWPGNVRELRNVIERASIAGDGPFIDAAAVEPHIPAEDSDLNLRARVEAFERELFREALRRAGGKKSEAARMLGIDPSNWSYHSKRLGL
jgi:two-component system response regulator HydG